MKIQEILWQTVLNLILSCMFQKYLSYIFQTIISALNVDDVLKILMKILYDAAMPV